jgi:hypothetical protein
MTWLFVCGGVLCGWAMLRTMGGERERRLREREAAAPASAQTPPPPPSAPSKPALGKLSAAAKRASRQAA